MNVYSSISTSAESILDKLISYRRDFHKYAETGWFEVRTASLIARRLTDLGYEVLVGADVCKAEARMGVPPQSELDFSYSRSVEQGADMEFAPKLKDGFTGVIGILKCGEGPTVAMRFDIDALGVIEDTSKSHRPANEGFASVNSGSMHSCGHDGHASIGLGVAEVLMGIKDELHGTIKLIFQPAEEGVRGALSIVEAGHLDNVDYFLASHITGLDEDDEACDIYPGAGGSLATTKLDAYFYGQAAHAGGSPEKGKNVILAVATAVLNLSSIPRHSMGSSRINVGTIKAGSGRNVIADEAKIEIEVRGATTEINKYVEDYAYRIIQAAATMHDTNCKIEKMGGAFSLESDLPLMKRIAKVCSQEMGLKVSKELRVPAGGSEDVSYMMKRVQENGGQAAFMMAVGKTFAPGHSRQYDFDEKIILKGVKAFCGTVYNITK